jgi:enoyl-CoA hydratase/carnithine racemase
VAAEGADASRTVVDQCEVHLHERQRRAARRIGRVGVITLNKPAKLNAWDRPMRDEIVAALRGL